MLSKGIRVFILFIVFTLLVGCDYDEKSFQALNEYDIPIEVTRDFTLPRGIYGEFIWTSSNEDVIAITSRDAKVVQTEKDIIVTITARINKKTQDFDILVLKAGSDLTLKEKYEDFINNLETLDFLEYLKEPIQLPEVIDGYEVSFSENSTDLSILTKKDGSKWLVPALIKNDKTDKVELKVENYEHKFHFSKSFSFRILVNEDNEHTKIFESLEFRFSEGNNKDFVTTDFYLPINHSEDVKISYTLNNDSKLQIIENLDKVVIPKIEKSTFDVINVSIEIDEIEYKFYYIVTLDIEEE